MNCVLGYPGKLGQILQRFGYCQQLLRGVKFFYNADKPNVIQFGRINSNLVRYFDRFVVTHRRRHYRQQVRDSYYTKVLANNQFGLLKPKPVQWLMLT